MVFHHPQNSCPDHLGFVKKTWSFTSLARFVSHNSFTKTTSSTVLWEKNTLKIIIHESTLPIIFWRVWHWPYQELGSFKVKNQKRDSWICFTQTSIYDTYVYQYVCDKCVYEWKPSIYIYTYIYIYHASNVFNKISICKQNNSICICMYMCMVGNFTPFQKDSKCINFTNPGIQLEDVLSPFIQRFYLQCPNLLTLQNST